MALRTAAIWLCSLAVLSATQGDATCSSQSDLFEQLSANLKVAVECNKNLSAEWNSSQVAELLQDLKALTEALHRHQLTECKDAEPKECPQAEVPENGGLICIPVANKRYCKPMCNHGYDFSFLRTSRLYEECSKETNYHWTTQYVGGSKLAVCQESSIQISGAKTAYFPKDQDCLVTKASESLRNGVMDVFLSELRTKGVEGEPLHACFVCG